MPREITTELTDEAYQAVLRVAERSGWTPAEWASACLTAAATEIDSDPLLNLAGTVTPELADAEDEGWEAVRHPGGLGGPTGGLSPTRSEPRSGWSGRGAAHA